MRLARHTPLNLMDIFSWFGIGKEVESNVRNLMALVFHSTGDRLSLCSSTIAWELIKSVEVTLRTLYV
jgi:hypothetical protein